MRERLLTSQHAWTGVLLLLVGALGALGAFGVLGGPGGGGRLAAAEGASPFPALVAGGLLVVGASLLASAAARGGARVGPWPSRPCAAVVASVLTFAAVIERGGLVAAVAAAVVVAGVGSGEARTRETLVFAVVLAAVIALLFVGALRQPLDIGPRA